MSNLNEELIDELTQDVEPVRRLWSPLQRFSLWVPFCFVITALFVIMSGDMRSGYSDDLLRYPRFFVETFMGFFSAIVAAYYAFEMTVPGREWTWRDKLLSISPFLAFLLMSLYSAWDPALQPSWEGWRFGCEREIWMFGAIPMLVFFILGRRAATIEKDWTGLLIGIAAMAPAASAMQLACMYQPWHTLGFHIAPVMLMAYVGLRLARKFFTV